MAESEELKTFLRKVKEESENVDLILNIQKLRSGIRSHHFIANRWRTIETVRDFILGGAPKSLRIVTVAMKLKDACSLEEKL